MGGCRQQEAYQNKTEDSLTADAGAEIIHRAPHRAGTPSTERL
jgi:hypothetical protein